MQAFNTNMSNTCFQYPQVLMDIDEDNSIIPRSSPFKQSPFKARDEIIFNPAEARIKNDICEYSNPSKRLTTKIFEICLSKYEVINEEVVLFASFKDYFVLKFVFKKDYPYTAPSITYVSGRHFQSAFDMEGNLKMDCLRKDKWSPVLSLNTLIFSIELLLLDLTNNCSSVIGKKKFSQYESGICVNSENMIDMRAKLRMIRKAY